MTTAFALELGADPDSPVGRELLREREIERMGEASKERIAEYWRGLAMCPTYIETHKRVDLMTRTCLDCGKTEAEIHMDRLECPVGRGTRGRT